MKTSSASRCGDRSTSDVVVRLRTHNGRDDWMYSHSQILIDNSKYFADRLSDNWPTCQILDSRNCVEVYCDESDFDYYVTVLRLFYVNITKCPLSEMWNGVKNALCILRVAVELGCPQIITACVSYMESVPWEEAEEEEILKVIPGMGLQAEPILNRLQPVNPTTIVKIFISAVRFATSSPPLPMTDLKTSAQEQLEYMLTEDDDAPLLTADNEIKIEVRECVKRLLARFNNLIDTLLCGSEESDFNGGVIRSFHSYLGDLLWACQILAKLETMREVVNGWIEESEKMVKVVEKMSEKGEMVDTSLKVVEVTAKVLEAIGDGTVILSTVERLHMVKVWLPFVRCLKPLIDCSTTNDDDDEEEEEGPLNKMEGEVWQTLESAFVSIILTLPSLDQAEILTSWLRDEHIRYPDLTEAFEVWCYRSKVANKRLALLGQSGHGYDRSLSSCAVAASEIRRGWEKYLHMLDDMAFRFSHIFREGNVPADILSKVSGNSKREINLEIGKMLEE
ncbi:hypothetical protein LguiA_030028 [Lonicera macranthoides]